MRNDIQKVVCERQRGGSSERSLKTALKITPKFFITHRRQYSSFEDFRELVLEYCEDGPSADIIGGIDYCSDFGPMFVSSARHRQEGRCSALGGKKKIEHKRHNENTKPLFRFFRKNLGRPWDDVYSEFCALFDHRSDIGYNMFRHLDWMVAQDILMHNGKPYQSRWGRRDRWWEFPYTGLYVNPVTGILCEGESRRYERPDAPVTSIHWYGDTWFKLEVLKDRNTECGCVHFKVPPLPEEKDKPRYYYRYNDRPPVCVHGHEPTPRPIWYVYTYSWHKPDEVFRVVHHGEYEGAGYGLKEGETHTIYYRDVPTILAEPITQRKKVANKKELQLIHEYLETGGVHQSSPEPKKSRYSRFGVLY